MQYIGFMINDNEYTVPITKVQEIINIPPITKLPQSPPYIEGIINMRGKIISVINLKSLMGFPQDTEHQRIMVLSSGKVTFGVLVDSITGVISIDEKNIEPSENILTDGVHNFEGVAKLNDRLLIMLDPKRVIPVEDIHLFEDEIIEYKQTDDDKVEVVKKVEGIGGDIFVKEIVDAKKFFSEKGLHKDHPHVAVLDDIVCFLDALSNHDYEHASQCVGKIIGKGQEGLYKELGRLTRKVHDTIATIRNIDAPRLKDMAVSEIPSAVDNLHGVLQGTESAANRTLEIVERYLNLIDEQKRLIEAEGEEVACCRSSFLDQLSKDLTELMIIQEFQDLTGRTLKQVIDFIEDMEREMLKIITDIGLKADREEEKKPPIDTVTQEEVDSILKDLGF